MSITAVNGKVVWRMTPNRARKIAALLRAWLDAQADLMRPAGVDDPSGLAQALYLADLAVVPAAALAATPLSEGEVSEFDRGPYGYTVTPDGRAAPAFGPSPDEAEALWKLLDCGCHPDLRPMFGALVIMSERWLVPSPPPGDKENPDG